VPVRWSRKRLYRWEHVRARLSAGEDRALRQAVRALGFQMRQSGTTVAGYSQLLAEWHPTRNGELTPWQVSYGSDRRLWWACPKGPDHEWQASVCNRTAQGTGCPYCSGRRVSVTASLQLQGTTCRLF